MNVVGDVIRGALGFWNEIKPKTVRGQYILVLFERPCSFNYGLNLFIVLQST